MALTARERKMMIIAVAAVVFLVSNKYILSPILDKRSEDKEIRQELEAELDRSQTMLERKKLQQRRWIQMQEDGLGRDIQKAESMVYRYIETSSYRSGLELGSIQPDRLSNDGKLGEVEFVLSGTGSMASVTRFLWDLETARIPLKIKSYQLGSKNEKAEVMTVQVELSTVYAKEKNKAEKEGS